MEKNIRSRSKKLLAVICSGMLSFSFVIAQENVIPEENTASNTPASVLTELQTQTVQQAPTVSESPTVPQAPVVQAEKPDALKLYREGRDYDTEGNSSKAREKYESSVAVCRLELKENSKNIESYVVLGWSLIRLGQYNEVISISKGALKISPREYRIIENLAEGYFYIDNYEQALTFFEQYLTALPNGERSSTVYFFMGDIYRLSGRYEHADIAYSAALQKSPNMPLWWYRLGSVRELSGKKAEAKTAYEKALHLKPVYPEARDALNRVS